MISLRYEAELLRQLHFTPGNPPPSRDKPPHIIRQKFFCDYCSSLHSAFKKSEEFRDYWIERWPEPTPGAVFFLVLPKLHSKNLSKLQLDCKNQHVRTASPKRVIWVGMREPLLWQVAGQVRRMRQ
jgi:hypothetical protein